MSGAIRAAAIALAALPAAWSVHAQAQSPGCQRLLRQAQAQQGAARGAALRNVAANCPGDRAGQTARGLLRAASAQSAAETEARRRAEQRRRAAAAGDAERERRRRLAAATRERQRAEEEARVPPLGQSTKPPVRPAPPARPPAARPSGRTSRGIAVQNCSGDAIRVAVVYRRGGRWLEPSGARWDVPAGETVALIATNGNPVLADEGQFYYQVTRRGRTSGGTRTFQYGQVDTRMARAAMVRLGRTGPYQIRLFCS